MWFLKHDGRCMAAERALKNTAIARSGVGVFPQEPIFRSTLAAALFEPVS
jgi:hypothetical protein